MKLLHTGDLHIGMTNYSKLDPQTGLESRLLDFFHTFDEVIEVAITQKVDVFLFAGDAYKTRDPSPTQQRGFGERLKKLTKAGIPVILAVGNHDTPNALGKANTLDIYSALEIEGIWVSRKPELLNIPTKSGNLQVLTLPWLSKENYQTIGDQLFNMYEQINNGPAVLIGHAEVEGASYGSEKGLVLGNDLTIPLSLLTNKKLSYVALGHIHKYQILNSSPPVIYSGSLERIDFGEEKEEKGFILVEISPVVIPGSEATPESNKKDSGQARMTKFNTTHKFIPTSARKFLTIAVDLKEDLSPTETILKEIGKHDLSGKIVRLQINIPSGLDEEIEMDQVKKALSAAFTIAGISRNMERVNRVKLEGTDEVERLTPIEALQKYLETKKYSPEKIKELEKSAAQLLE